MDLKLKGKVVIVTGAGQGIGRAIASTFAEEGARVAVAELVKERGETVAANIQKSGGQAIAVPMDVTSAESVNAGVKTVTEKFGPVDILVNNAAVWVTKPFARTTRSDWDKEVNVIFYGALNCIYAVVNSMMERKSGAIISITSDAGRGGEPYQPVYSGVKAGLIGLTRALCKDLAKYRIRVNCVSPGLTETEAAIATMGDLLKSEKVLKQYPLGKIATPQDLADTVVFLASERAGHITGQTISVNGGYYAF